MKIDFSISINRAFVLYSHSPNKVIYFLKIWFIVSTSNADPTLSHDLFLRNYKHRKQIAISFSETCRFHLSLVVEFSKNYSLIWIFFFLRKYLLFSFTLIFLSFGLFSVCLKPVPFFMARYQMTVGKMNCWAHSTSWCVSFFFSKWRSTPLSTTLSIFY